MVGAAIKPAKRITCQCNRKTILVCSVLILIYINPLVSSIQANVDDLKKNQTKESISASKHRIQDVFLTQPNNSNLLTLYNKIVKRMDPIVVSYCCNSSISEKRKRIPEEITVSKKPRDDMDWQSKLYINSNLDLRI